MNNQTTLEIENQFVYNNIIRLQRKEFTMLFTPLTKTEYKLAKELQIEPNRAVVTKIKGKYIVIEDGGITLDNGKITSYANASTVLAYIPVVDKNKKQIIKEIVGDLDYKYLKTIQGIVLSIEATLANDTKIREKMLKFMENKAIESQADKIQLYCNQQLVDLHKELGYSVDKMREFQGMFYTPISKKDFSKYRFSNDYRALYRQATETPAENS